MVSIFSSAKTAEVMPTLVAARAEPMNRLVSVLSPNTSPAAVPAANGTITPITPTRAAVPPTSRISESFVSRPTQKSRKTTPSSAKTSRRLAGLDEAEDRGPDHEAGEDLADQRRLVDPLEDLVADLGRDQDHREIGDDTGDGATRREGKGEVDQPTPIAWPS